MTTNTNILFLDQQGGMPAGYKGLFAKYAIHAGLSQKNIMMMCLSNKEKNLIDISYRNGKKFYKMRGDTVARVSALLDTYIKLIRPKLIVTADCAVLGTVADGNLSLDHCRGSVYGYKGIPVIIVHEMEMVNRMVGGQWIRLNDWQKIARYYKDELRVEPRFEYKVCRTLKDIMAATDDLLAHKKHAIGGDIETYDDFLTCVGYGQYRHDKVMVYVFPLMDSTKSNACFWETPEEEQAVWDCIWLINDSDNIKIYQGGAYDNSLFIKYRVPSHNYYIDTAQLWHSLYAELPKRLDFITSICVDRCQFWKEESKGVKEIKVTIEAQERFYRYNALDIYYMLLNAQLLLPMVLRQDWALANYTGKGLETGGTFTRQVGPAMHMSLRGLKVDFAKMRDYREEAETKKETNLQKLQVMLNDANFNPNSNPQVAALFYDILGSPKKKIKGKTGGADKVTLKALGDVHPIYKWFANAIADVKSPDTELSRYLNVRIRRLRFHTMFNSAGTETSRFSAGRFLWEGTNGQTIPEGIRDIFVADGGWLFWNADYRASDAVFMAYESGDENYIKNVTSGLDTHILHAAHFFKQEYSYIEEQYEAKNPVYYHNVTGRRAITKRIVHGSNFRMAAFTLFILMGKDATIAAAEALGYKHPHLLGQKELIGVCNKLLRAYIPGLYPDVEKFFEWIDAELKEKRMLTTAFGFTRLFLGDPTDGGTQREGTAFFGQGDTAGNINKAIDTIYYKRKEYNGRLKLLLQVHDSLGGLVKIGQAKRILTDVKQVMERPHTIRGREMFVPVEIKVGKAWGEGMETWKL